MFYSESVDKPDGQSEVKPDENAKGGSFRQRKAAPSISSAMNEAFFLEDGHEDGIAKKLIKK